MKKRNRRTMKARKLNGIGVMNRMKICILLLKLPNRINKVNSFIIVTEEGRIDFYLCGMDSHFREINMIPIILE